MVTSEIKLPGVVGKGGVADENTNLGSHFQFGNDLRQKNHVDSIIPGAHEYHPSIVEVWTFDK